jgi:undecaprenyl-diphosphatase
VFGSGFYELNTALTRPELAGPFSLGRHLWQPWLLSIGWAVIAWLMRYIQTKSFMPFVIYRIVLGAQCHGASRHRVINPL